MFKLKRCMAWTVPAMLQAALLSAGPLFASDEESEKQVLSSPASDEVKDVDVLLKVAVDEEEESEVRSNSPVLKSRTVKARPTKTEPSDERETEVGPKKKGPGPVISGGRITVKSADGKSFEIVAPEGAIRILQDKLKELPSDRPVGPGRFTILRTPDGGEVQLNQADTLLDDLTLRIKDKIATEAPKFIIGVSVSEAPEVLMVQLGRKDDAAVVVDSVMDDSPAAKAGVKQFDLILKAAGEPVRSAMELTKAVKSSEGKEIELLLLRAGNEFDVVITPRPNEPVRRTKTSDGTIHFGPGFMERKMIGGSGELMLGHGPLLEEIKALRKDMAELKETVEKLKAEK